MKKNIGKILASAAAGFILMYLLLDLRFDVNISLISFELTIIFLTISLLLIIFSILGYLKIKSEVKKDVKGNEEDERDARLYRLYGDVTLAANIAMYFSTLLLAIVALTDQHNVFVFISLAIILVSISLNYVYSELIKTIYPERNLPSVNDKQYAKKLLDSSDEGERHIMLQGMYRAFTSFNALLFFAVLLLIAYSVISGVSQLFGIFIIILILVITNTQYMLTIRNK